MDHRTKALLTAFDESRRVYKKLLFGQPAGNESAILSAFLTICAGKTADAAAFQACRKLLRKECGTFSAFRGVAKNLVITRMALSPEPEEYLRGCLRIFRKLRAKHKSTAPAFTVMAAVTLYERGGTGRADAHIAKLEELHKALKEAHPLLVSDSDRGFLAALVCLGASGKWAAKAISADFEAAKQITPDRNCAHSLAQVLVFNPAPPEQKAQRVEDLLRLFRERGIPVQRPMGLSAVGALTLLECPDAQLADTVCQTAEALKAMHGFRRYRMSKGRRMLYAGLITLLAKSGPDRSEMISAVSGTMTAVIIQQIILTLILSAATVPRLPRPCASSAG